MSMDFSLDGLSFYLATINFLPSIILQILFWGPTKKYFAKWKLSKNDPKPGDFWHGLFWTTISYIFATIFGSSLINFFKKAGLWKVYADVGDHGILYWVISFIAFTFYVDAVAYWYHRFLHLPWIYKTIHYIHHRSVVPTPAVAGSHHPLERLGMPLLTVFLPMIVCPLHSSIFLIHGSIERVTVALRHLGHDFLTERFRHIPILNLLALGSHHDFHHSRNHTNYSSFFVYWDRWMGTETPYFKEDYQRYSRQAATSNERLFLSDPLYDGQRFS